jgi:hypothetical protein
MATHQATNDTRADTTRLGRDRHEPQDVQDEASHQDRSHDREATAQGIAHGKTVEQIARQAETAVSAQGASLGAQTPGSPQ